MATTVKTKGPTFSPEWRFQQPIAWRDTDLDEKTLVGLIKETAKLGLVA